eukprot:1706062-Prymnesium_polylepis.3
MSASAPCACCSSPSHAPPPAARRTSPSTRPLPFRPADPAPRRRESPGSRRRNGTPARQTERRAHGSCAREVRRGHVLRAWRAVRAQARG